MTHTPPSELLDFTGKTVLVTGGGSGIGAGIARRFARSGADVAILDLDPKKGICQEILDYGVRVLPISCDLTDVRQVSTCFEEIQDTWGALDALVNNAGIYPNKSLMEMLPEDWDSMLNANLKSAFLCTQMAAKQMISEKKPGAIVNIASTEALRPAPDHSHYAASKAGVLMFSRNAAFELGRHNIRVNTVSPGLINRPGLADNWPEGYSSYIERAPLGRVGEPEDIGDACLFLASDAARWITGAHLVVDGGIMTSQAF